MHDVTIILKQNGTTMYTTTTPTSGLGNYQFLNVANGDYTVYLSTSKIMGWRYNK